MDVEKKILNCLLENSKLSFREMAKKVKVSAVTVLNKVKKLEKEGVVRQYTVELDYDKLGYEFEVLINMRISKGKLFQVQKKIATHPNVSDVYDVTGAFDSVVVAKFKSRNTMDGFLKKIQSYDFVERTQTALILNTLKKKSVVIS